MICAMTQIFVQKEGIHWFCKYAQFRVVPDQIRIRLQHTYCTAWYGCQTWLLNTTSVKGMNIEWKKAVRRTLNLPRTTRSKLVPLLAGNHSFQEQHERRWGALYVRMMHSENKKNLASEIVSCGKRHT